MWTAATKCGLRGTDGTDERLGSRQCRAGGRSAGRRRANEYVGRAVTLVRYRTRSMRRGPAITRGAEGYAATYRYSWTSPPSTSWRLTASESGARGAAGPAGKPRSRPRCGRPVL